MVLPLGTGSVLFHARSVPLLPWAPPKLSYEGARPTGVAGVRRGQTPEETVRGLVAGQHRHRSPCAVCTSPILLFETERSRSNRRCRGRSRPIARQRKRQRKGVDCMVHAAVVTERHFWLVACSRPCPHGEDLVGISGGDGVSGVYAEAGGSVASCGKIRSRPAGWRSVCVRSAAPVGK